MPRILRCLGAVLIGSALTAFAARVAYITDPNPWNNTENDTAMTAAVGAGNWDKYTFSNAVGNGVFTDAYDFVFVDGGAGATAGFTTFVNAHRATMESWVHGGKSLFLNAARWYDTSAFDLGFGGTLISSASSSASRVDPAHAIFNEPTATGATWTGSSFSHDYVTGAGLTAVIVDSGGRAVLAERTWGAGHVMLGGITTPNFHLPIADARTLRVNTLYYGAGLHVEPPTPPDPPGPAAPTDLYRATLHSVEKDTFVDTCRAPDRDAARAAFESRHPGATIGAITYVPDAAAAGYRLFLGGVRTADGKNLRDTCWARNPAEARLIIAQRFPGSEVNHTGLYPQQRTPRTYAGVTQRADLVDVLAAPSLREAFDAFACRYPRESITRVVQISRENPFATYEAAVDPEDITVQVQAGSTAEAAAQALAQHPDRRVVEAARHRDGVETYEARVHTADGRSLRDTCSARSADEARKLLQDRHGVGSRITVGLMDSEDGHGLYVAMISSASGQQGFADATLAKTAAAAAEILRGRYPTSGIGSVTAVADASGYREFHGSLSTPDGQNVRDTCWAGSPSAARKVFLARFPGASVHAVARYGSDRPDVFEVRLKGEPSRQRCEARDKAEAFRILSERCPQAHIAALHVVEEVTPERVYRAVLTTADRRRVEDTAAAKTAAEARRILLTRHPGSRIASFQPATAGRVDEVFEATIELPPAKDTCQAYSPAEARTFFQARYPRGSTGALRPILDEGP